MDADELISRWGEVRQAPLATIDKFSEDELRFAPFDGAYTVGETALHIAHEEAIEILYGLAREWVEVPPPYELSEHPNREAIKSVLASVHERSRKHVGGLGVSDLYTETAVAWGEVRRPIDVILHVMEHEIHHRGELSLMLGLLGRMGLDA